MLLRSLKWSGLIIAAVLLLTAAASIWIGLYFKTKHGFNFMIRHGGVSVSWHYDPDQVFLGAGPSLGWSLRRHLAVLRWWPEYKRTPVGTMVTIHQIHLPLWIPALSIGAPAAWLWRRDRPKPPYACQQCGYDLRGVSAGAVKECPECGVRPA